MGTEILDHKLDQVEIKQTKSQQVFAGRSEITQQMSGHRNIDVLNSHYNKHGIETRREYASEVSKAFPFIQRRST